MEEDHNKIFNEFFEKYYNGVLAKLPLVVLPEYTLDFFSFSKAVARKNTPLTLCKSSFYYTGDLLEKHKEKIITYNFNLPAGAYQAIIQIKRDFHILLSLSAYEKPEFSLGFVPFFAFNDGQDYLNFINDNKEYESHPEEKKVRAGFGGH